MCLILIDFHDLSEYYFCIIADKNQLGESPAEKDSIIQLTDCYLFFYLKCVEGNQDNATYWIDNILSPAHSTWSGLAFERVCFAHIPQIK